jgi:hypothetical protein
VPLDALALLDCEGGGRFVLSDHHDSTLRPAATMSANEIFRVLHDDRAFVVQVAGSRAMPARDIPALRRSWAVQNGLLEGTDLERLLWLLRRFRDDVEYDLRKHLGVDLGELWRARRWRMLLNYVDRLPRASWTYMAMTNDPSYAEAMADAIAKRSTSTLEEEPPSRPLVESTPEVAVLSDLVDAVNALRATFIMANKKPGSPDPVIPPYPRPVTLVDRMTEKAKRKARWAAHESLADRILLRRRTPQEAPE